MAVSFAPSRRPKTSRQVSLPGLTAKDFKSIPPRTLMRVALSLLREIEANLRNFPPGIPGLAPEIRATRAELKKTEAALRRAIKQRSCPRAGSLPFVRYLG